MTRDPVFWSAHHQHARGHARGGGTRFRFPTKEAQLLVQLGWKNRTAPGMASAATSHVAFEAAVAMRAMPMPRAACGQSHRPRRRAQNSDTTQDQQVAHAAFSGNSRASSPFLLDQAMSLPCK